MKRGRARINVKGMESLRCGPLWEKRLPAKSETTAFTITLQVAARGRVNFDEGVPFGTGCGLAGNVPLVGRKCGAVPEDLRRSDGGCSRRFELGAERHCRHLRKADGRQDQTVIRSLRHADATDSERSSLRG